MWYPVSGVVLDLSFPDLCRLFTLFFPILIQILKETPVCKGWKTFFALFVDVPQKRRWAYMS